MTEDPSDGSEPHLPAKRVSSGDLERVIRRATELQFDEGSEIADLPVEELVRIGEEVGLEPRHVRRALAEVQAESLLPALPTDAGLALRLWGEGVVRHSRAVRGAPADVQARVERHFEEKESLKRVREQPGRSVWEPATGLLRQMQRTLDVGGHGYELAKVRNVQLAVEGLEEGWALVTISADLRNVRAQQATGWMIGLGLTGVGAAVALLLTATGPGVVLSPVLVAGAIAGGSLAAGRTVRRARGRIELVILGLLDRLERGEIGGDKDVPVWREWLASGPGTGRRS